MPDEFLGAASVRLAGLTLRFMVDVVWDFFLTKAGRLVIFDLPFGRVDKDLFLTDGLFG